MVGTKFNRLTILEEPFYENKIKKVKVRCDCGTEKIIRLQSIINNLTKSCGCLNNELRSNRASKLNKKYSVSITHPLYNSWKVMKRSKLFVDPEWKDNFENFYNWAISNGYEKGLVFSTKDKNIGYTKNTGYFHKILNVPNQEKIKATCLAKYGVNHPGAIPSSIIKRQQTNLIKYGSISPFGNKEIQEKIKKTNLEKYGYENPVFSPEVQEKTRLTNLEKHGVEYVSQNQEIRQKQINTLIGKYGTIVVRSNNNEQDKIMEWLNSLSNGFIKNKYFNGKEIDIFNEKLKLGIEYCGLYWHCEDSPEPRTRLYHKTKLDIAKNNSFRLITIFSDEWLNRQAQVKNFLKSVIGIYKQRIFARKCIIKEVNKVDAKLFINKNHIQGYGNNAIINFGLYNNNILIGIITLDKHHRNSNDLILKRLCFEDEVQIIGGASKLFKACINWANEHNYNKIISWSDNRWSEGNVYNKLKFKLDKILNPDYSYVLLKNPKKRISKQRCQKKAIGCPKEITESSFMKSCGYSKIWDCGKIRWVYKIKEPV